jgi:type IV secretion system protein VirB8
VASGLRPEQSQLPRAQDGLDPGADAEASVGRVERLLDTASRQADDQPNVAGPQVVYGPTGEAQIEIRAITFVAPKVASVRFHRVVMRGGETTPSDWIATIAFGYTKAPMAEGDRWRNPLGFQVSSYRSDPEVGA